MGLMFAWATKEYLLWEMTIGQIVLYYNNAVAIRNGTSPSESEPGLVNKDVNELRKLRDDIKAQSEQAAREALEKQYGDIG